MVPTVKHTDTAKLECCPQLETAESCDSLDIVYRLPFRPIIGEKRRIVPVEVSLRFRLTRCSEGLALGDLAYTTTLLPGEKVRLRTSDRHTRFSFDSETNLAYHHEATSEESFFMAGMANAVSDLSIVENSAASSRYSESSVSGGGGASLDLFFFEIGGGASGSSYSSSSASQFARSVSRHAESSSRHVEVGVRAASSTSIGEVERRTHTETESESHYEACSRLFENPNRCHAVSFFFYKINKKQRVTFELIAIERRIQDPVAPTGAILAQRPPTYKVSVLPRSVAATAEKRLEIERNDRLSRSEMDQRIMATDLYHNPGVKTAAYRESFTPGEHVAALEAVKKELVRDGLLDAKSEEPTSKIRTRLKWERNFTLPTAGIIVKGCLDECNICEPALREQIKIEIDRKKLENQMFAKQIELLDKSQEYRCCPEGMAEQEEDED